VTRLLYRDLLGDAWEILPAAIRRLHEYGGDGEFRVYCRGAARLLAAAGWLPHAAESVHVSLRIERDHRRERWIRTFGDRVLASTQWAEGGLRHFVPSVEGVERAEGNRVFVNVRIGSSFAYTGLIKPR
jgi:hypothetical protein